MPTNANTRVPLIGAPEQRDGTVTSKDQRYVNCIHDVVGEDVFVYKRPGLALLYNHTGEGRGLILWDTNKYYVVGDTLYKNGVSLFTLPSSTGIVGFAIGKGTESYLFMCDGTKSWVISTTGTVTEIGVAATYTISTAYVVGNIVKPPVANGFWYQCQTAGTTAGTLPTFPTTLGATFTSGTATFITVFESKPPSPHIPSPIFMDGYIFLSTETEIYNSKLEEPRLWNSSEFISAEMYPDKLVALSRQTNQLVAIGEYSTEFFYDAGNAVGSPLARTDQAVFQGGAVSLGVVTQTEGLLGFVASSVSGSRFVVVIDGMTPTPISTPTINKILDSEATPTSWRSCIVRLHGALVFVLSLATRTIVYNFVTKLWSEFTGSDGGKLAFSKVYSGDAIPTVLATAGPVFTWSPTTYQDNGALFTVTVQTNRIDAGNSNRKFMNRLEVVADEYGSSNTVMLSFSDDDYATWSTARGIDLAKRGFLYRLGSFRRRAFRITHAQNLPLRLRALDLFIDGGTH